MSIVASASAAGSARCGVGLAVPMFGPIATRRYRGMITVTPWPSRVSACGSAPSTSERPPLVANGCISGRDHDDVEDVSRSSRRRGQARLSCSSRVSLRFVVRRPARLSGRRRCGGVPLAGVRRAPGCSRGLRLALRRARVALRRTRRPRSSWRIAVRRLPSSPLSCGPEPWRPWRALSRPGRALVPVACLSSNPGGLMRCPGMPGVSLPSSRACSCRPKPRVYHAGSPAVVRWPLSGAR